MKNELKSCPFCGGKATNKIGKQWKFKKSELDDWVKTGKSAIIVI